MKIWEVPVTVVERGRVARVKAHTKREALEKARAGDWLDGETPTGRFIVTVVGAVRLEEGQVFSEWDQLHPDGVCRHQGVHVADGRVVCPRMSS